jgi:lipopolysaccharide/colanic/teichoic acid biosynthesis glycosyltransferase
MAVIALLIRRESGPPVIFRQERVGQGGRTFQILKFRSMVTSPAAVARQSESDGDHRKAPATRAPHAADSTPTSHAASASIPATPDAATGPLVTADGDPRITRLGARLRSTKLDELPQLANVLRGEMSIVGPRPDVQKYVDHWEPTRREIILSVRPGITDPATVAARREAEELGKQADPEQFYIDELLPMKEKAYVDYVLNRTFTGDIRILLQTLWTVASR